MPFVNKKSDYSNRSDNDLVKAILKENNRQHIRWMQEELYERYVVNIYAKCVSLVKSRDIAKDLTHDIFLIIFLNLHNFRGDGSFHSYVYSITYNHCFKYLEKEKKLQWEDLDTHSYKMAVDEIELEHKILQDLRLSHLEILIGQISESEKMILLMRYQDEMSLKQIARTLCISESAAKMRLKRSRDHLAELFKKFAHDPGQ